jgi:hypothetical protein
MTDTDSPREFAFELALCATLEELTDWVLGRQLGAAVAAPGRRIADIVGVRPGSNFDARAEITAEAIPVRAVESDVGAGQAVPRRRAVRESPVLRESTVDAAVEAGFFTSERRDGREYVRQATRYPDGWFDGLVGIENKPDLGTPGSLERQLRVDIELGVFDRVVVATGSHVTRAHLNRLPPEAGVWRFDPDTGDRTVVREPTPLPVEDPGVEVAEQRPLETEIEVVDADAKARARRRIAERTYGKGWRPDDLPACAHADVTGDGRPACVWFDRVVDPRRECGPDCPGYDSGPRPDIDTDALRDARTPWRRDPPGVVRRQSGLDRFRTGDSDEHP